VARAERVARDAPSRSGCAPGAREIPSTTGVLKFSRTPAVLKLLRGEHHARMNANRSALMTSAFTVHMPCEKPG
jgi:hypothetical protein